MKLFVLLTVVGFVASLELSEEKQAKFNAIRDKCISETGAAADVCDKIMAGDFSNEDKSTKCFINCFYQDAGFFDKDGNFDLKVTIEKVAEEYGAENAEKWVTPCKDKEETDPCDKAFEIAKCFYKQQNAKA